MEKQFKGTPGIWHAVNYCGFWNIQDGEYYGENNLLDAEKLGEDISELNANLCALSPNLLEMLIKVSDFIDANENINYKVRLLSREVPNIKELINKALGNNL